LNDILPNDIQPNDIHPNDIHPNDIHLNDISPNDIQTNDIQPNDIQPNDIQPNDILLNGVPMVSWVYVYFPCVKFTFYFPKCYSAERHSTKGHSADAILQYDFVVWISAKWHSDECPSIECRGSFANGKTKYIFFIILLPQTCISNW
jgi:hypothetical protein